MRNILVTGGTVFVSRYVAEYFAKNGDRVFVLNRNSRPQSGGVTLIEGDRHHLGDKLKQYDFDVVLDITAYTREDVECLIQALGRIDQYIFISSSAVYPEDLSQPFKEEQLCGPNSIWGDYGIHKLEAENIYWKKCRRHISYDRHIFTVPCRMFIGSHLCLTVPLLTGHFTFQRMEVCRCSFFMWRICAGLLQS